MVWNIPRSLPGAEEIRPSGREDRLYRRSAATLVLRAVTQAGKPGGAGTSSARPWPTA
jgi:hypothetical protein